jgi:hypothetical protein
MGPAAQHRVLRNSHRSFAGDGSSCRTDIRHAAWVVAADAAARRQDRSFFESRYRPETFPDRAVAAPLNARPFGASRPSSERLAKRHHPC